MSGQRYKEALLETGYFAGLRFFEGTLFFVTLGREETNVQHTYAGTFGAGTPITVNSDGGFETPTDSSGRNLLEPGTTDIVHQIFTGIAPTSARLFRNFPSGRVIQSLRGTRSITGNVGYIRGEDSPYEDPDPKTELWCTKDIVPDFDVFLPPEVRDSQFGKLNHIVIRYKYAIVQDENLIREFVRRERRVKVVTMGSPDALVGAPAFVLERYAPLMDIALREEVSAFGSLPSRPA